MRVLVTMPVLAAVVACSVAVPASASTTGVGASAASGDVQPVWARSSPRVAWTAETVTAHLVLAYTRTKGKTTTAHLERSFKAAAAYVHRVTGFAFQVVAVRGWTRVPHLCSRTPEDVAESLGLKVGRGQTEKFPISAIVAPECGDPNSHCLFATRSGPASVGAIAQALMYWVVNFFGGGVTNELAGENAIVSGGDALRCVDPSGAWAPLSAQLLQSCGLQLGPELSAGVAAVIRLHAGLLPRSQIAEVRSGTRQVTLTSSALPTKGVQLLELAPPGKAAHLFVEANVVGGALHLIVRTDSIPQVGKRAWFKQTASDPRLATVATTAPSGSGNDATSVYDIPDGQSWMSPATFDPGKTMPSFTVTVHKRSASTVSLTVRVAS